MAPSITPPTNYSLFSIPAYLILAMVPHVYSTTLLQPTSNSATKPKSDSSAKSKSQPGMLYNMSNPRSSANANRYSSNISPSAYAQWERARAAHANMLENSAFFVSAILAGVITKCEAGYMNRVAGLYLATRVAYIASYVGVSKGPLSFLRTAWYFAGILLMTGLWWEAGKRVMVGNY